MDTIKECIFISEIKISETDESIREHVESYLNDMKDYCVVHGSNECALRRNNERT